MTLKQFKQLFIVLYSTGGRIGWFLIMLGALGVLDNEILGSVLGIEKGLGEPAFIVWMGIFLVISTVIASALVQSSIDYETESTDQQTNRPAD